MIDLENISKHPNARFIIINLLNNSNNWLANVFIQLGCFKEKQAMQSAIDEYIKTMYKLQNAHSETKKSYLDFLMTDKDLPTAVIVYLLNTCLANSRSNFFQVVCALYIALEGKESEYEKYYKNKNLTENLYLFFISHFNYRETSV